MFMLFFPIDLLKGIAHKTNRYGNQDWVRPANNTDAEEEIDKDDQDQQSDNEESADNNTPRKKKSHHRG
jgi:hypothetical protein